MNTHACCTAINGIRNTPGDAEGWTDGFVTEKFESFRPAPRGHSFQSLL